MSAHTPGPWSVGEQDRNEQVQVLGPEGQLVAVACHECLGSRLPEMEANARLIALAPELLAALEGLVHDYKGQPCWCALDGMVPYRGHDGDCEAVRALITKARGAT